MSKSPDSDRLAQETGLPYQTCEDELLQPLRTVVDAHSDDQRRLEAHIFRDLSDKLVYSGTEPVRPAEALGFVERVQGDSGDGLELVLCDQDWVARIAVAVGFPWPGQGALVHGALDRDSDALRIRWGSGTVTLTSQDGQRPTIDLLTHHAALLQRRVPSGRWERPAGLRASDSASGDDTAGSALLRRVTALRGPRHLRNGVRYWDNRVEISTRRPGEWDLADVASTLAKVSDIEPSRDLGWFDYVGKTPFDVRGTKVYLNLNATGEPTPEQREALDNIQHPPAHRVVQPCAADLLAQYRIDRAGHARELPDWLTDVAGHVDQSMTTAIPFRWFR